MCVCACVSALHNKFSAANSSTAHGPLDLEFSISYGASLGGAKGNFTKDTVTVRKWYNFNSWELIQCNNTGTHVIIMHYLFGRLQE